MADAGELQHLRPRPARGHLIGRLFGEKIRLRTAQYQRRAADRVPHAPKRRWLRLLAEWHGDAGIVGETPAPVDALPDVRLRDILPLRVGERAEGAEIWRR